MTADPMADAPRNEPIEALFDGEWLEVEWSETAWDGSPYGTEGWASDGMLTLDLEAWRYPGDPEPHGCPTHGDDCPGHLHWEAGVHHGPPHLGQSPAGPEAPTVGELQAIADRTLSKTLTEEETGTATTRLLRELRVYKQPEVRHPYTEAEVAGMLTDEDVAPIMAALNAAMVEAGGIRPQRAVVGVDLAADSPVIVAHDDGTVSWAEFDGHLIHQGVDFGVPSWHDTYQAVREVVAKHAPDYGTTAVHRHRGGHTIHYRAPGSALWSPPRHDVPELTPPPPATGCSSRGAFLYEGESWQVIGWPGYPQDELLERLNLRWRYGHPPATPDRARRAGVRT